MKWIQEKSKNFDDWFLMHFDLFKSTMRKSNKWIKKVTIHFLKPMVLSYLKLHFTTTRSSTFSGFNLALLGLTTLPATEKTRSDLDEAAGTGKTTLTSLAKRGNWDSWCFHHSSDDLWASPLVGLYLHRRHFAMAPSRLSLKYLQTLDACFFGTTLFFWMGGCRLMR